MNLSAPLLVHQQDGSYSGIDLTPAPGQFIGSIPNIGRSLSACIPKAASGKTIAPGPDVVGGISARTASGNYVIAQLNTPQFNQNVAIQTYDSNFKLINSQSSYVFPSSAAFTDYNHDGLLDLLVNEATCTTTIGPGSCNSLLLFAGKADGSFALPATIGPGFVSSTFQVADFNGDGLPDLLVPIAPARFGTNGSFALYLQQPDHSLGPAISVFSSANWIARAAIGDLNRDGFPDLVFAPTDGIYVALNDGTGHFPNATLVPGLAGDLAIGDVNGDGFADIVTSGTSILFGDGRGGFTGRANYEPIATPQLFDLDGDGTIDLVGADKVLFGLGGGKFWGGSVHGITGTPLLQADLNGDGIPDVVARDKAGNALVFTGAGDGTFTSAWSNSKVSAFGAAIADVNGDSKPDLLFLNGSGINVVLNRGGSAFSDPVYTPAVSDTLGFIVGDFNGDGKMDVAAYSQAYSDLPATNEIVILLGKGDGSFTQGSTIALGSAPSQLVSGDFHGNGHLDLIVLAGGLPMLLTGKGDGTFSGPAAIPVSSSVLQIMTGDFNRDGRPDLMAGANVLLGQGNGQFLAKPNLSFAFGGTFVADIDGDGILDVIGDSSVLLGNGDGTFQSPKTFPGSPLLVADFNKDGKPDFLTASITYLQANSPNPPFALVSAVTNTYGPLAPESLATVYGSNLSSSVSVTDANGTTRSAPVLYASPSQVNFEIPAGTSTGQAHVNIGGQTATVPIQPVAPALFTVQFMTNPPLILGSVVIVAADGTQTIQPITQPTLPNGFTNANPAHLSGAAQTYLIAYGSGLRAATSATVLMGSTFSSPVPAKVVYLGPAPGFTGLDQINIQLPPLTLEGSAVIGVTVYLGVDGIPVNTGTFAITN